MVELKLINDDIYKQLTTINNYIGVLYEVLVYRHVTIPNCEFDLCNNLTRLSVTYLTVERLVNNIQNV